MRDLAATKDYVLLNTMIMLCVCWFITIPGIFHTYYMFFLNVYTIPIGIFLNQQTSHLGGTTSRAAQAGDEWCCAGGAATQRLELRRRGFARAASDAMKR